MSILTVATTKGGAGKTTLARLILARLALQGLRLAAIDADLNRTLADWTSLAKFAVTVYHELDKGRIVPLADELSKTHDVVVIDTAGAASDSMLFAIGCSDLVLIPLQPSLGDIVEAVKTFQLIKSASLMLKRDVLTRVVLLSVKETTGVAQHILTEASNAGLPLMQTRLSHLVAFQEMSFTGMAPAKGKAAKEIAALMEEIAALDILPEPSKLAS